MVQRDAERRVPLGREGPVADLGVLEGHDHVGGGPQHGEVAGDGGGERHLHPVVRRGVRERGGEHLDDGDVAGHVGQDRHDHNEPVHARHGGHLIGAAAHGDGEEGLGDAGVVERADEEELADEQHEEAVVDLGQGRLGFRHQFLLLGLDLVAVHVVRLLDRQRVALGVVLGGVGAGIVVLPLVRGHDHEDSPGADGDDADVESEGEEDQEDQDDDDLQFGPDGPPGVLLLLADLMMIDGVGLLDGGLPGVVGVLLGEHLGRLLAGEHDAEVLDDS